MRTKKLGQVFWPGANLRWTLTKGMKRTRATSSRHQLLWGKKSSIDNISNWQPQHLSNYSKDKIRHNFSSVSIQPITMKVRSSLFICYFLHISICHSQVSFKTLVKEGQQDSEEILDSNSELRVRSRRLFWAPSIPRFFKLQTKFGQCIFCMEIPLCSVQSCAAADHFKAAWM